ncbi:hypothetical protein E1B28_008825 [Marasmius oreades]|uniref:DUF4211 domain-containing protein n=1 Tax=Marasmius oreades TaxID=181124 RepID=A0A9P7S0S7_9AGAR|nr:uncharacterized protein E1B28_008825 [Marasmius oreades]KAG7092473.1 hypothetical protein E1B28_008825 [Marasmius oreades]
MAPQKRARKDQGTPKLTQTSLLDHMPSSPAKSTRSPTKPKSRRSPTKSQLKARLHLSDNSDDETSDIAAIRFEPLQQSSGDDDEEEETLRTRTLAPKRKKVVIASDDSESEGDILVSRRKRKQTETRTTTVKKSTKRKQSVSTTDSEDVPIQPKRRRRLVKGERASSSIPSEESSEDDLGTDHILNDRFRARGKQTAFQRNLEKLKRKKQGKPMELPESDRENGGFGEEEFIPFAGAKPHVERSNGSKDEDEDEEVDDFASDNDFIVEDDNNAPAVLPLEFSMESHQDLSHQFKKIFQFFVHIATRQPSDRHDFMLNQLESEEYFSVPLQMFRRKLLGLRDSLVASSVWRPEFKNALERHPNFDLVHLDFAFPGCDACHLGARMSTYSARLSGKKYCHLGYEVQAESESEDDEDDEDNDESASDISSQKRRTVLVEFNLGRFCARRTRVYHDITHWEYSLFKSVDQEVRALQGGEDTGFVRVAFAGGRKPPEDIQDADAICEWLDERRVIDFEWQRLNGVMENARNLEMMAKRGQDLD